MMSALLDVLLERAKRHGLRRETRGWHDQDVWRAADGNHVVWEDRERELWRWAPPSASITHAYAYPGEAAALEAALQWFDAWDPDKAWRPPAMQWAPAVDAVRVLREVVRQYDPSPAARECLLNAVALLERMAGNLHQVADEERIEIALDLALDHGELSGALRRALSRGVQTWPEVLAEVKIAGTWTYQTGSAWTQGSGASWVRPTLFGSYAAAARWRLTAPDQDPDYHGLVRNHWQYFPSLRRAMEASDDSARQEGWTLIGAPPQTPSTGATP